MWREGLLWLLMQSTLCSMRHGGEDKRFKNSLPAKKDKRFLRYYPQVLAALSETREGKVLSVVKYKRPTLGDSPWLFCIPLTPADLNDPLPLCRDMWYKCWGRDVGEASSLSLHNFPLPGTALTHKGICYVLSFHIFGSEATGATIVLVPFQFDKHVTLGTLYPVFKLAICNQAFKDMDK